MQSTQNIQNSSKTFTGLTWQGPDSQWTTQPGLMSEWLKANENPLWVIATSDGVALAMGGEVTSHGQTSQVEGAVLGIIPAMRPEDLGDKKFQEVYGAKFPYYTGAMANGIASERLVIAMGKAGYLGSFGSAGLGPDRIQSAIDEIKMALPQGPYAFNLINSPSAPDAEARAADLYVTKGVRTVEASAYVDITVPLVYYRAAGLESNPDGSVRINNRIIAKLSRREVAKLFLQPAPEDILQRLLAEKKITKEQAQLARQVSMADDITAEADSGGHTDNRPLVGLFPSIVALRDEMMAQYGYQELIRVGAGGGIGTPEAAFAAFMMGAAYIVTGSVNQSCYEAGTSEHTRNLLAQAEMADVAMAPASDMFEMGVRVQVLKRGTLFPMRAQKLWEIYADYPAWEDVPIAERDKIEKMVFKNDFASIWEGTEAFFKVRDPRQVERANRDPHHKMALVFRWYLGLSSRWSNGGEKGREMDYQIWCGPSMGAFNDWARGSFLEAPENRSAVEVARQILSGVAFYSRLRVAESFGLRLPADLRVYLPKR
ncbi:PfaD family polyunsaturated fatty acid/polyketide biosynthesis protein [bacterium]|nr:PfaD family polyunsaturated fatty acid/polyketide biosynthesis protein [bacterium]